MQFCLVTLVAHFTFKTKHWHFVLGLNVVWVILFYLFFLHWHLPVDLAEINLDQNTVWLDACCQTRKILKAFSLPFKVNKPVYVAILTMHYYMLSCSLLFTYYLPWPYQNGIATHFWAAMYQLNLWCRAWLDSQPLTSITKGMGSVLYSFLLGHDQLRTADLY